MHVGQAWHQDATIPRDDLHTRMRSDGDGAHGDALDDIAANQHIGGSRQRRALPVKNPDALKKG
jgi:hypothetical protein